MSLYEYNARVLRIIDGDTIEVSIDLGFGVAVFKRLRFARANAWEKRGPEREKGLLAEAFVTEHIPPGTWIQIKTTRIKLNDEADAAIQAWLGENKMGKYGRYVAEIWCGPNLEQNLCDMLVERGHGRYVKY